MNVDNITIDQVKDPNCSPKILAKILREGKDDGVSWYAAGNSNCPPEILAEVLRRNKDDDVSWRAAGNSNCPPIPKRDWEIQFIPEEKEEYEKQRINVEKSLHKMEVEILEIENPVNNAFERLKL